MEQLDEIFKGIGARGTAPATLIACLFTGSAPPAAATPMPRDPSPATGAPLDGGFADEICAALAINSAVHDGAILFGRPADGEIYRVFGWSYRLFPSARGEGGAVNRGSAFHSCWAMSLEPDVDAAYLVSQGRSYRFVLGGVTEL